MNPTVILGAGHGIETKGKRSPIWTDGTQLMEYEFNRDVILRISSSASESISREIFW